MAKHNTLSDLFKDTANAIRERSGKPNLIIADDFPDSIRGLPGSMPAGSVIIGSSSNRGDKMNESTFICNDPYVIRNIDLNSIAGAYAVAPGCSLWSGRYAGTYGWFYNHIGKSSVIVYHKELDDYSGRVDFEANGIKMNITSSSIEISGLHFLWFTEGAGNRWAWWYTQLSTYILCETIMGKNDMLLDLYLREGPAPDNHDMSGSKVGFHIWLPKASFNTMTWAQYAQSPYNQDKRITISGNRVLFRQSGDPNTYQLRRYRLCYRNEDGKYDILPNNKIKDCYEMTQIKPSFGYDYNLGLKQIG